MSDSIPAPVPTRWLSVAEAATAMGETPGRVRRMLDDRQLAGCRHDGVFAIPEAFLVDGRPLASLRGTLYVLHDAGFGDEEAIRWLLTPEETIGQAPLASLLQGRKSEVRRVAQTLA